MDGAAALRGIAWTVLSYGSNRVVSIATTIVLARLLVPEDFGLYALATLAIGLVSIFSGMGLGMAVVLRQDLDRRGQGTALSMLIAAGLLFAGALALLSPLIATAFDEERLQPILVVIAAVLAVSGPNWFYESLLQRELAFRSRFVSQLVRTVVFSATALVLAIGGAGVWALIWAHVAGHLANTVALLIVTPYRVAPAFDRSLVRSLLRSGGGFALQDLSAFLQQNIDYVIVGRALSASRLGFYTMAFRQAELPLYAIAEPAVRVTFPHFSQMRHRGEDIVPAYLTGLRLLTLVTLPAAVVLSAASAPFVLALFGPQWPPMIGPLTVLGIWAGLRPIEMNAAWLLNSLDRAGYVGRTSLLLLLPLAVGVALAATLGDITAVAWVMVGHMAAALLVMCVGIRRCAQVSVARQLGALLPLVGSAGIAWVATRASVVLLEDRPAMVSLVVAGLVAGAVYLAAVRVLVPGILGEALARAKGALRRGSGSSEPSGAPTMGG